MTQISERPPRIGWIDTARGLAVLLVVLLHTYLLVRQDGTFPANVGAVNFWLGSIRLPVLFLVSGILSCRLLRRSFPEVAERRIWPLVWVLAVWTLIGSLLDTQLPLYPIVDGPVAGLQSILWTPQGNLWFLYALILYTAMGHAVLSVRGWPRGALLLGFFLVLGGYMALRGGDLARNLVQYYPFFMAGLLLNTRLDAVVRTRLRLVCLTLLALAGMIGLHAVEWPGPVERGADAALGAGLGLGLAQALQRLPTAKAVLDLAGRHSLAIFVGHQPFIAAGYELSRHLPTLDPVLLWLALFAFGVAASSTLAHLARRIGLGWLYRIPRALLIILSRGRMRPVESTR